MMKKLFLLLLVVFSVGAFALDQILVTNQTTYKTTRSSSPSLTTVTLAATMNYNVVTSDAVITTGNINIPILVNGSIFYIKAHTAK